MKNKKKKNYVVNESETSAIFLSLLTERICFLHYSQAWFKCFKRHGLGLWMKRNKVGLYDLTPKDPIIHITTSARAGLTLRSVYATQSPIPTFSSLPVPFPPFPDFLPLLSMFHTHTRWLLLTELLCWGSVRGLMRYGMPVAWKDTVELSR